MLNTTILEFLEFIDYRDGLYIFEDNKLLKAKPYTIEGQYKSSLSGVSFYDSACGETHIYLDRIHDEYILYGNVLFEKDMCVKDRQVLNSVIQIDYSNVIDFCHSDDIKYLKDHHDSSYVYREKDNALEVKKTTKNNSESLVYNEKFKYLSYIREKYGLYIFYGKELVEVKLSTIDNTTALIEFNHPNTNVEVKLYIDNICEKYYLYGNVLFQKGLSIKESAILNEKFPIINWEWAIDFASLESHSMIKNIMNNKLSELGRNIYYSKKINNDKVNKLIKTTKNNKEQNTMKNNFSDIINMKMMMGIINNKGEIDLTKLMVLQSFAKDGTIEVTDIIKTKLTEKILKDTNSKEDLPLEKLALINMLDNGNLDLQEIIKYKMLSSDDVDMEKMMLMSCMTNGGDITDIFKYKMMSQMLKETDTETK